MSRVTNWNSIRIGSCAFVQLAWFIVTIIFLIICSLYKSSQQSDSEAYNSHLLLDTSGIVDTARLTYADSPAYDKGIYI